MSNLALAKAALKKTMDKRVIYKPNVLEAEAKGTASKQAYEAKSGDIDQLDLNYLDSLNRITGTLKNTYMESVRRFHARRRNEDLWDRLRYHEAMLEAHSRTFEQLLDKHKAGRERCEAMLGIGDGRG